MDLERKNSRIYVNSLSHPRHVSQFLFHVRKCIDLGYQDVVLDFRNSKVFYPNAVVPIAGIIEHYLGEGIEFLFENIPSILANMGIQKTYNLSQNSDIASYSILNRVWKFDNYDEVFEFVSYYLEELQQTDQFEEGVLNGLEWSLNEVMDNVIQHSNSGYGYVMGQVHKNSKHVAFCVFDSGQGIFNSLKKSVEYRPRHPVDAITLCIKEGVTRDTNIGQGNGLFGLHQILKNNEGQLSITSNGASFMMKKTDVKTFKNLPVISWVTGCTSVDFQLDYNNKVSLEDALSFGGKKYSFVNFRVEELENNTGEIEYIIKERSQGYGTRKAGSRVRNDILNIYNESKKPINLDFKGVSLISSSFADEVIGKLVLEFGFFGFNNVIRLKNMNNVVQSILQRSVSQRMAESLNK